MPITSLTHRLVVRNKAPAQSGKRFIWVIVEDSERLIPVQTSDEQFQFMEEAYDAGQRVMSKYLKSAA